MKRRRRTDPGTQKPGFLIIALLIVTLCGGGLVTGLPAFWLTALFLLLLLPVDLLMLLTACRGLSAEQTLSCRECVSGRPIEVLLELRGSALTSLCTLECVLPRATWREAPTDDPFLLEGYSLRNTVTARDVGMQYAGLCRLRAFSPFGFFCRTLTHTRRIQPTPSVLVLPRLDPLAEPPFSDAAPRRAEDEGTNVSAMPDSVCGSHPYLYGEPLNRINWKLTAARQELYTREFEGGSRDMPAVLYVLPFSPALRQEALEAALAGGDRLLALNDLRVVLGGQSTLLHRGDTLGLARLLARSPQTPEADAPDLPAGTSACVVAADPASAELPSRLAPGSMLFLPGASPSDDRVRACAEARVNCCLGRRRGEWVWQ